ncbi:MAG TPA: glycosyl hydrolase family 28-related protein [Puia sp.]|nr:glycosyl hydrolase family 28-related protein [Puia sp.]
MHTNKLLSLIIFTTLSWPMANVQAQQGASPAYGSGYTGTASTGKAASTDHTGHTSNTSNAGRTGNTQSAYSLLWGKTGEKWDTSRIPDFTSSGYQQGRKPIPAYPLSVNVKKMGAAGDGLTDDTRAIRKAIGACKEHGAVYFPEGRYRITDSIQIGRSSICLRGAGRDKTILLIDKGLEQLYPLYGITNAKQTQWSWSGAMILFTGDISDAGIEDLGIRFPDSLWAGHNFHERAYNAIGFSNHAHDGWVRNITLTGCDVGIWIESTAHHITAENWLLDFGPNRKTETISGHHGVNIYGGYNLLQHFEVSGKFWHDLSVESIASTHNVFHHGKGADLCIDHHNHDQRNNLFTNLDAGQGSRIWFSGGNSTPRGISFHETYWNIRATGKMLYCDQYNDARGRSLNNVVVGLDTDLPSQFNNPDGNWFETIDPAKLIPQDLYQAQLDRHHTIR